MDVSGEDPPISRQGKMIRPDPGLTPQAGNTDQQKKYSEMDRDKDTEFGSGAIGPDL